MMQVDAKEKAASVYAARRGSWQNSDGRSLTLVDDRARSRSPFRGSRSSSFANESLRGFSLIAIRSLSNAQIAEILSTASQMKKLVTTQGGDEFLKGKILASVLYGPSTHTNCSFQAAMLRQGGSVITVNESSFSETLSDTVRSMECYCDGVVLRHPRPGAAAEAAAAMSKPLFNAGEGVGEHHSQAPLDLSENTFVDEPVPGSRVFKARDDFDEPAAQALSDLYTIVDELSGAPGGSFLEMILGSSEESIVTALSGKIVTMVGDLKNGRAAHSLAKLLSRFGITLNCVSPAALRMPAEVEDVDLVFCTWGNCSICQQDMLTSKVLAETDILYVTRVQKECFESAEAYNAVKDAFIVTPDTLAKMKASARVLHAFPRGNDLDHACDADPRAAYFRQMTNGMYVRMALLRLTFG